MGQAGTPDRRQGCQIFLRAKTGKMYPIPKHKIYQKATNYTKLQ
jgi:hypothetical protein